jgi:hypothetical protein
MPDRLQPTVAVDWAQVEAHSRRALPASGRHPNPMAALAYLTPGTRTRRTPAPSMPAPCSTPPENLARFSAIAAVIWEFAGAIKRFQDGNCAAALRCVGLEFFASVWRKSTGFKRLKNLMILFLCHIQQLE